MKLLSQSQAQLPKDNSHLVLSENIHALSIVVRICNQKITKNTIQVCKQLTVQPRYIQPFDIRSALPFYAFGPFVAEICWVLKSAWYSIDKHHNLPCRHNSHQYRLQASQQHHQHHSEHVDFQLEHCSDTDKYLKTLAWSS